MLALFTAALVLSSFLFFILEPVAGRLLLPRLGGGPSVWSATVLFFQVALLAASACTWKGLQRLPQAHRWIFYASVLGLSIALWPSTASPFLESTELPAGGGLLGALMLLARHFGLPVFTLGLTTPLFMDAYSKGDSKDLSPLVLSGISSVGSIAGLLAYPFLVEPQVSLSTQLWWGRILLGLLLAIAAVCAWLFRSESKLAESSHEALEASSVLHAVALPFASTLLLLGGTRHITNQVAAAPLFWILPLAAFLASWVVGFTERGAELFERVRFLHWPLALLALILVYLDPHDHLIAIVGVHVATVFWGSLWCHSQLFLKRPADKSVLEYYFWIATGGALSSFFCSWVSPFLFDSFFEYPLSLFLIALGMAFVEAAHRKVFFGAAAVLLVAVLFTPIQRTFFSHQIFADRSFFGAYRVHEVPSGSSVWHELWNGNILHGKQYQQEPWSLGPVTYYHPTGPIWNLVHHVRVAQDLDRAPKPLSFGVVGLGTGTMAALGKPGEEVTFFEIDRKVEEIATDTAYFSYVAQSPANVHVEIGDARTRLNEKPDASFDLIVLDAFTSDSVPAHLLTLEAIRTQFRKLKKGGGLALHVTNWHLDLESLAAAQAKALGAQMLIFRDTDISPELLVLGKYPSIWIIMTVDQATLDHLHMSPDWKPLWPTRQLTPWTDELHSIVPVLRL